MKVGHYYLREIYSDRRILFIYKVIKDANEDSLGRYTVKVLRNDLFQTSIYPRHTPYILKVYKEEFGILDLEFKSMKDLFVELI
jgi:hypothetical protein